MSNKVPRKPNKKSGLYHAPSHAEGGVEVVVDNSRVIEVEGEEYHLCGALLESDKVFEFKDKTPIEILDDMFQYASCTFEQGKANSNDVIICKKSVRDKEPVSIKGTAKEIINFLQLEKGCNAVGDGEVAESMQKGGKVKLSEEELEVLHKRWSKKRERIEKLSNNIQRLRYNVTEDMKSNDERVMLTALVVAIMLRTAERIGNEASAAEGHVGVTGFKKSHVSVIGNKIHLRYTGKSGVEHDKSFSDERIAKLLKKAIKNSPCKFVFCTSDGFRIKADRVNRYLSDFEISAKDIRGYMANRLIVDKLKGIDIPKEERDRKKLFLASLRSVAEKVGHGAATLRKHYVVPELMTKYVEDGKIINLSDRKTFDDGGAIPESAPAQQEPPVSPKYPLEPNPVFNEYEGEIKDGVIFWVSPDDFLALAQPLYLNDREESKIANLVILIKEGRSMNPALLGIADGAVVYHDGRHRAHACKHLGIDKYPVFVFDESGIKHTEFNFKKQDKQSPNDTPSPSEANVDNIEMKEGGRLKPSSIDDPYYYVGCFDNTTKKLKHTQRFNAEQVNTPVYNEFVKGWAEKNCYVKEITKEVYSNFSPFDEYEDEMANGGQMLSDKERVKRLRTKIATQGVDSIVPEDVIGLTAVDPEKADEGIPSFSDSMSFSYEPDGKWNGYVVDRGDVLVAIGLDGKKRKIKWVDYNFRTYKYEAANRPDRVLKYGDTVPKSGKIIVVHGSPSGKIDKFSAEMIGKGWQREEHPHERFEGVWFADNTDFNKRFTGYGHTHEYELSFDNSISEKDAERILRQKEQSENEWYGRKKATDLIKSLGYDLIYRMGSDGVAEYISLDVEKIKPVNMANGGNIYADKNTLMENKGKKSSGANKFKINSSEKGVLRAVIAQIIEGKQYLISHYRNKGHDRYHYDNNLSIDNTVQYLEKEKENWRDVSGLLSEIESLEQLDAHTLGILKSELETFARSNKGRDYFSKINGMSDYYWHLMLYEKIEAILEGRSVDQKNYSPEIKALSPSVYEEVKMLNSENADGYAVFFDNSKTIKYVAELNPFDKKINRILQLDNVDNTERAVYGDSYKSGGALDALKRRDKITWYTDGEVINVQHQYGTSGNISFKKAFENSNYYNQPEIEVQLFGEAFVLYDKAATAIAKLRKKALEHGLIIHSNLEATDPPDINGVKDVSIKLINKNIKMAKGGNLNPQEELYSHLENQAKQGKMYALTSDGMHTLKKEEVKKLGYWWKDEAKPRYGALPLYNKFKEFMGQVQNDERIVIYPDGTLESNHTPNYIGGARTVDAIVIGNEIIWSAYAGTKGQELLEKRIASGEYKEEMAKGGNLYSTVFSGPTKEQKEEIDKRRNVYELEAAYIYAKPEKKDMAKQLLEEAYAAQNWPSDKWITKMEKGGEITEADESASSKEIAILNFKEQIQKGESMGVVDMYELAALRKGATFSEIEQARAEAKGMMNKGGNSIDYYAVYEEKNLGYVFHDSYGKKRFGILRASILKGSHYNELSDPLYIGKWEEKDLRKATERDFEEFRVVLPPDFKEKNGDASEMSGGGELNKGNSDGLEERNRQNLKVGSKYILIDNPDAGIHTVEDKKELLQLQMGYLRNIEIIEDEKIKETNKDMNAGEIKRNVITTWESVPETWKVVKKVPKVPYINSPYDKGLQDIMKYYVSEDALRPTLAGVFFDETGITATDANKPITLPFPNKNFSGIYCTIPSCQDVASGAISDDKVNGKYPQYQAIFPEENSFIYQVSVYKLRTFVKSVMIGKYADYKNIVSFAFNKNEDGYSVIAFDANYMLDVLESLLKLGYEHVFAGLRDHDKMMVLSPSKPAAQKPKEHIGKEIIVALMPRMLNNWEFNANGMPYAAFDADNERYFAISYSLIDDEIYNADGKVAVFDYNLTKASNQDLTDAQQKIIKAYLPTNFIVPIQDYVKVDNDGSKSVVTASNLEATVQMYSTNKERGIYRFVHGALDLDSTQQVYEYNKVGMHADGGFRKLGTINRVELLFHFDKAILNLGKDQFRPHFMGVHFIKNESTGNKLIVEATNMHTLYRHEIKSHTIEDDVNFVVSNSTKLVTFLKNIDDTNVTLHISGKDVAFESETGIATHRTIEGKYPNTSVVIPKTTSKKLSLDITALKKCIKSLDTKKKEHKDDHSLNFVKKDETTLDILLYKRETSGREVVNTLLRTLCSVPYEYKEQEFTNNGNVFLGMPKMTDENDAYFSLAPAILQTFMDTTESDKLNMYFTEQNRAILLTDADIEGAYEIINAPAPKAKKPKGKIAAKIDKKDEAESSVRALETLLSLVTKPEERRMVESEIAKLKV